jgi:hypothetical protein
MLRKIDVMKGVLIRFPNVQNRADSTFDASVYTECVDALLKKFKRRFRDRAHGVHCVFHYQSVSRKIHTR